MITEIFVSQFQWRDVFQDQVSMRGTLDLESEVARLCIDIAQRPAWAKRMMILLAIFPLEFKCLQHRRL